MTGPQHIDMARVAQLEHRVQALEDVNAIRHLKARYAAYCDDQYNPDGIAALFTEDAVWESQGLGRFEGRHAIREFFRGASRLFTFAIHYTEVPPRKMLIQVCNILFLLEKIFEHFSFCSHVSGNFCLLSLLLRAIMGPCI